MLCAQIHVDVVCQPPLHGTSHIFYEVGASTVSVKASSDSSIHRGFQLIDVFSQDDLYNSVIEL
jgi:hypothetical protein